MTVDDLYRAVSAAAPDVVRGVFADGRIDFAESATKAQRKAAQAVADGFDWSATPPATLTGATLLDVLSDAEFGAAKGRDIMRLSARGADALAPTNSKLARVIKATPGLTYDALLARLPGTA